VFGRDENRPFSEKTAASRAGRAWADLTPIGFHEARHTFASYMIAADLNAKTITTIMGHSSISTTFDLYGHLFPGSEAEARGQLDAYLAAAP
jgi:integrase